MHDTLRLVPSSGRGEATAVEVIDSPLYRCKGHLYGRNLGQSRGQLHATRQDTVGNGLDIGQHDILVYGIDGGKQHLFEGFLESILTAGKHLGHGFTHPSRYVRHHILVLLDLGFPLFQMPLILLQVKLVPFILKLRTRFIAQCLVLQHAFKPCYTRLAHFFVVLLIRPSLANLGLTQFKQRFFPRPFFLFQPLVRRLGHRFVQVRSPPFFHRFQPPAIFLLRHQFHVERFFKQSQFIPVPLLYLFQFLGMVILFVRSESVVQPAKLIGESHFIVQDLVVDFFALFRFKPRHLHLRLKLLHLQGLGPGGVVLFSHGIVGKILRLEFRHPLQVSGLDTFQFCLDSLVLFCPSGTATPGTTATGFHPFVPIAIGPRGQSGRKVIPFHVFGSLLFGRHHFLIRLPACTDFLLQPVAFRRRHVERSPESRRRTHHHIRTLVLSAHGIPILRNGRVQVLQRGTFLFHIFRKLIFRSLIQNLLLKRLQVLIQCLFVPLYDFPLPGNPRIISGNNPVQLFYGLPALVQA